MTARAIARGPHLIALFLVLACLGAAIRWGAFVAGGSDSNCYLTGARLLRSGTPLAAIDTELDAFWSNAALSLAPTGFAPSAVRPGALAPICPPGLSAMMGGASIVFGDRAMYAVVPLCGALTVWCAFLLGRRMGNPWIGSLAAALTLALPVFLFQLFQPMSDVPAAAFALLSLVCLLDRSSVRTVAAGFAAGIAVLIRPNLVVVMIPLAGLSLAPVDASPARRDVRRLVWFVAGAVPAIVALAALNTIVYGAPLRTGYGDPSQLFAVSHIAANARRYFGWTLGICSPWIGIGLVAPLLVENDRLSTTGGPSRRAIAFAILGVSVVLLVVYLPYSVFDDWTYVRFLLPALVMLVPAAAAATWAILRRLSPPAGIPAAIVVAALLLATSMRASRAHDVFTMWQSETRFVDAAEWIDRNTPPGSVIVTIWHSGSIRYYAHRTSILWDAIEPAEFDAVVQGLESRRRPVYLLLESWEVPRFTQRFSGATPFAALDWQPRAQIGRDIAVYALSARDAFRHGEATAAERVFTTAERQAFGRRHARWW